MTLRVTSEGMDIIPENDSGLLALLADDRLVITYRPRLNQLTGSVTATILLQQIIYRYHTNDCKPFYKFKEPAPKHSSYVVGDSWTEELGFTRREFDGALKLIGRKGNPEEQEPGEELVHYWTDQSRMTFYAVNECTLAKGVKRLYVKAESAVTKRRKAPLDTLLVSETTKESKNRETELLLPSVTDEAYPGELACLKLLENTPEHPYEANKDREYLRRMAVDFNEVDPLALITSYSQWIQANSKRNGSRSVILTFFKGARQRSTDLKLLSPGGKDLTEAASKFEGRV